MRALVLVLGLASVACAQDAFELHYDSSRHKEDIAAELSLSITIEGTDQAANFVRSMHPLLSLQSFHARVQGTHEVQAKKNKVEHDDARVLVRYDDEDSEYDWKRSEPPADLATNKLEAMIWYISMSTRSYDLDARGKYRSDDPNQDANGEALDLFLNGVTRLRKEPAKPGDAWTAEWKGSRSDKQKKGAKWSFKQTVTFEKLAEEDGRRVAILTSQIAGTLSGDEDPNAEEKWTRCEGATRVVLDVANGWIREQWGRGAVTSYFKNTAEDGSKNEVTVKLASEGKRWIRK